jgi:hypothetical protein
MSSVEAQAQRKTAWSERIARRQAAMRLRLARRRIFQNKQRFDVPKATKSEAAELREMRKRREREPQMRFDYSQMWLDF